MEEEESWGPETKLLVSMRRCQTSAYRDNGAKEADWHNAGRGNKVLLLKMNPFCVCFVFYKLLYALMDSVPTGLLEQNRKPPIIQSAGCFLSYWDTDIVEVYVFHTLNIPSAIYHARLSVMLNKRELTDVIGFDWWEVKKPVWWSGTKQNPHYKRWLKCHLYFKHSNKIFSVNLLHPFISPFSPCKRYTCLYVLHLLVSTLLRLYDA